MFTLSFWKDTAERVVSSAAGGALTIGGLDGADILNADARIYVGAALGTGLVSLLKALAAIWVHPEQESASLVDLPGRHAADR